MGGGWSGQGENPREHIRRIPPGRTCRDGKACRAAGRWRFQKYVIYQCFSLAERLARALPFQYRGPHGRGTDSGGV
jgi:hypothetical protein